MTREGREFCLRVIRSAMFTTLLIERRVGEMGELRASVCVEVQRACVMVEARFDAVEAKRLNDLVLEYQENVGGYALARLWIDASREAEKV